MADPATREARQLAASDAIDVTPHSETDTVRLAVNRAPDVPNRYGPGSITPDGVDVIYDRFEDGGRRVRVVVNGYWRRADGELTEDRLDVHYTESPDEWPDWVAGLARDYHPEPRRPLPDNKGLAMTTTNSTTTEDPMERAYRNGAVRIPEDLTSEICEATNGGRPTGWPVFYDRDGEAWEASGYRHDGDEVMLPSAGNMAPLLRRDVLVEFGPLITPEQYDEYIDARNARLAAKHAAREAGQ